MSAVVLAAEACAAAAIGWPEAVVMVAVSAISTLFLWWCFRG